MFPRGLMFLEAMSGRDADRPSAQDATPGGTQVSTHTAGGVTKRMHFRPFELVILLLSLCSCCKRVLHRKQSLETKEDSLKPLDTASPRHAVCEGCEYLGLSITAVSKPSARAGTGSV